MIGQPVDAVANRVVGLGAVRREFNLLLAVDLLGVVRIVWHTWIHWAKPLSTVDVQIVRELFCCSHKVKVAPRPERAPPEQERNLRGTVWGAI